MEKCGTGPELLNDARRERMRSDIAMLRRPKAGGDEIWDAADNGRDVLTMSLRDNVEFTRALNS